jgi:hypothetical protein
MHRTLRAALATVALLALPQFAAAGPIEWSMRGDIDPARVGTEFYLGAFDRLLPNNSTDVVHIYGQMPEGVSQVGAGSMNRISLGIQSKNGYRFDATPPLDSSLTGPVTFNVWVTDTASGETGHLSFEVMGDLLTGLPQNDSSELIFTGESSGSLVLGGNKYDLTLGTGDSDSTARVYADLTVAPVAATPEPGTFALGALGLCALGAVRRVRKGAAVA